MSKKMLHEVLSRVQFAFTIGFHILWPAFTIGLCLFLCFCEGMYLKTKNVQYIAIYKFWAKIFALSFGMGVVTGLPMSFQFGTNFAKFSEFTAPVIGPLLSIEILTAFFLEAMFIGIMLFGWKKVHPLVHFFATCFVAIGTHNSAFWILVVNSWMQTPAGVEVVNGVLDVKNWREVIFNPSMPYRVLHMVVASYLTATVFIVGISASFVLRNKSIELAKKSLKISFIMFAFLAPSQIFLGDLHGLNTHHNQPAKLAAMEGHWETHHGAPFVLFAIPDSKNERNRFEVAIPKVASLLITHSLNGELKGLKEWDKKDRPMVGVVFWSFRIMLAIGFSMLGCVAWGLYLAKKRKFYENEKFLIVLRYMTPTGFVAVIAGWLVTEVGRQPWAVVGMLRISESYSNLQNTSVIFSLSFFVILYLTLFVFYVKFIRLVSKKGILPVDVSEIYKK